MAAAIKRQGQERKRAADWYDAIEEVRRAREAARKARAGRPIMFESPRRPPWRWR